MYARSTHPVRKVCLRATKDIPAGSHILDETPIAITNQVISQFHSTTWHLVYLVCKQGKAQFYVDNFAPVGALFKFDALDLTALMTIATQTDTDAILLMTLYWTIVAVNIEFPLPGASIATHMQPRGQGVYTDLSAINHSCFNNADLETLDRTTGRTALVSTRAISAGEEITLNYTQFLVQDTPTSPPRLAVSVREAYPSSSVRREIILGLHGFVCQCDACAEDSSREMDARIGELEARSVCARGRT